MKLQWFALSAALAMSATAWSADVVQHWRPASTTADAITGAVIFSENKIAFGNGRSLPLAKVGKIAAFEGNGERVDATLYRVTAPADLVLLAGNHLCGGTGRPAGATYVVLWRPAPIGGDVDPRSMAVFSGKSAPKSDDDPTSCGTFNYEADAAR